MYQRPFERGLLERIQAVKVFAGAEVQRLEETVRKLRAENERLSLLVNNQTSETDNPASKNGEGTNKITEKDDGPFSTQDDRSPQLIDPTTPKPQLAIQESFRSSDVRSSDVSNAKPQMRDSARRTRSVLVDTEKLMGRFWESQRLHNYNVNNLYKTEGCCQYVCKSAWFEYTTLIVVILNSLWVWIDIDFNTKAFPNTDWGFIFVNQLFCVFFFTEMLLRFFATKTTWAAITDRWFVFDGLLVVTMIFESWVLLIYFAITKQNSDSMSVGILSTIRILRLLRITRVARLCRLVPELKTMVAGMLAGVRSVTIAVAIFFGITYLFAIMLREMSRDTEVGNSEFGSVPQSVATLMVQGMLPDNEGLLAELFRQKWYLGVIFFFFLLLSAVTIMNMLVGILCDVMTRVSHEETEKREIERMSEKLLTMMRRVDGNDDGGVSKSEFKGIIENYEAVKILQDVGVDVKTLIDDVDYIFDSNGKDKLDFEDFKDAVLQFRATNLATIRTISTLRKFQQANFEDVKNRITVLEHEVQKQGCMDI